MRNISSLVEQVLARHRVEDISDFQKDLSANLEFRLLFNIDLNKPFKEARREFLKNYFNDLLTISLGNISMAAKRANLHRRHLHRMINELDLDADAHRRIMLKPTEYMRSNVHDIIEDTLSKYNDGRVNHVYSKIDDMSELIAKNIDIFSYEEALDLFEKEYIEKALKDNEYNVSKTAEYMEISERTLYRKMNRLKIAVA